MFHGLVRGHEKNGMEVEVSRFLPGRRCQVYVPAAGLRAVRLGHLMRVAKDDTAPVVQVQELNEVHNETKVHDTTKGDTEFVVQKQELNEVQGAETEQEFL